jgi:hypothetical protein
MIEHTKLSLETLLEYSSMIREETVADNVIPRWTRTERGTATVDNKSGARDFDQARSNDQIEIAKPRHAL